MTHGATMWMTKPDDRDVTRMIIDSEYLERFQFEVKRGYLVIFGGTRGKMALHMSTVPALIKELSELNEVYGEGRI